MAFAADSALSSSITAEFLSVLGFFSAKGLFLLRDFITKK